MGESVFTLWFMHCCYCYFTLEWYLFNKPSANILFLSIGDVFLSFIFPIIDLLLLLLGVTLIFRPAIFNAKSKLFIFILVLTGLAITDYLYFYLQGDLSERSVIFLRCLYRVFLLFIAIAATIPKNTSSKRNYFIINPTFGEKLLGIFPYLAVAVLIGFTLKEQTSSATLITEIVLLLYLYWFVIQSYECKTKS